MVAEGAAAVSKVEEMVGVDMAVGIAVVGANTVKMSVVVKTVETSLVEKVVKEAKSVAGAVKEDGKA